MFKKISLYFTALVLVLSTVGSAYAVTLKASHQWPGTPRADGSFDPRHEMVQIIADEVKKANVDIDIRIYPAKSLYKPKEQWKPMTTGQLDITAFPLGYAAKFHPEFDAVVAPICCAIATDAAPCQRANRLTITYRLITCVLNLITCDVALHLPRPHVRHRKRAVRVESSLVVSTRKASEGYVMPFTIPRPS